LDGEGASRSDKESCGLESDLNTAPECSALGVEPQKAAPAEVVVAKVEPEAKPEPETEELYVVEEKVIRGRPARVLSDGTVEAETDDGWMRFENLEHLDEYLEAMVPEA
jgi:hypothetical protein